MDKIDKLINFYYEDVSDAERFTLRALLTSFGVSSFNAGRKYHLHNSYLYNDFSEYLRDEENI